ncbi:MAG: AAA family ATPase, partial [Actinobacteria bacterium]|nr:AAA family ATPase [Actinomycetota bacterium]
MKISPAEIAAALKKIDNGVNAPTDEQILVISSPLEPAVVVAGAGSGKTETMSARVLWLVINGYVKPDQILGLTFTRKAAGELAIRIRTRLRQLMNSDLVSPELAKEIENNLDVTVLTYHSYAARVLSEHAIRIGIDADATPIGEAAAWQIASDAVNNFESLSAPLISAPSTVIDDVMLLSKLIAEHGCSVADVRIEMERIISALTALPGKDTKEIRDIYQAFKERSAILPIVARIDEHRKSRGLLTFDDQMSLAAELSQLFPDIGVSERAKFKVVLLDEYQDTSQSQLTLLSNLFGFD